MRAPAASERPATPPDDMVFATRSVRRGVIPETPKNRTTAAELTEAFVRASAG